MHRLIPLAVTALALAGAGIAIADGIGVKSIQSVNATFTATTVAKSSTRTCTNADGTFVLTNGTYTGAASGDLSGPLTLKVESLINTTENLGTIEGKVRIDTAGRNTVARLTAVYSAGQLAGLVSGTAGEDQRLLGNVSAAFSPAGGFSSGKIGSTAGGAAVLLRSGKCEPAQGERKKKKVEASGK